MKTKIQLQEELRKIEEKEFQELMEKHYPEFKKLEGKCFKIKNCYSNPRNESDYWFLYIKIQKIEREDLYLLRGEDISSNFHGISFQKDKYGIVSIDFEYSNYVHSMSEENEITNKEFKTAWSQLQEDILRRMKTSDVIPGEKKCAPLASVDNTKKMTDKDKKIIEAAEREGIPIFVLIAKDKIALKALIEYRDSCGVTCSDEHYQAIEKRIDEFTKWESNNQSKMKIPD